MNNKTLENINLKEEYKTRMILFKELSRVEKYNSNELNEYLKDLIGTYTSVVRNELCSEEFENFKKSELFNVIENFNIIWRGTGLCCKFGHLDTSYKFDGYDVILKDLNIPVFIYNRLNKTITLNVIKKPSIPARISNSDLSKEAFDFDRQKRQERLLLLPKKDFYTEEELKYIKSTTKACKLFLEDFGLTDAAFKKLTTDCLDINPLDEFSNNLTSREHLTTYETTTPRIRIRKNVKTIY